ncbi:hypothetical protein V1264_015309 [Littorina saxatilis]|uniref:F-box domain-containing protein n=1 Tax=Littorina saxatilis TaxID=31220 RepID=A0AAN9BL53_9CAEN
MAGVTSKKLNLLELPSEVLLQIISNLPYRSLCRIGRTCKQLRALSLDESLWKQQCQTEFFVKECTEEEGWLRQFRWLHGRFARHHSAAVYRNMRRLWDRLEKYLQENDREMYDSLREPCDYSEIQIAEQKMTCRFPADLRCSLQIHNGQQMGSGVGVYGCMTISTYYRSEGLLDAASMARLYDNDGDLPGCVPLTYCLVSQKSQYVAVNDEGGFTVGEVFYPTPDQYSTDADIFITGKTYTEWFTDLVEALESKKFPRIDGRVFRFHDDPECEAVTKDCFTVKATSCFMPDLSTVHPPHFFFTYRIM